ncbi:hypothetical protein ACROYT_G005734 [Oculina patagonica]
MLLADDCVSINFGQNPCASSPCQHPDTVCQAGFTDRGYRCICVKEGQTGERCEKVVVPIYVQSFGVMDKPDGSIDYGNSIIEVNGKDYCKKSRGHNIVTVYANGSIHASEGFDTYESSQAVAEMKGFIDSLPDNLIVLIAVHDSTSSRIAKAESALYSLGAVPPVVPLFRESWLLVGYKGPKKPAWIQQRHGARNMGPVHIRIEVVL